MPRPAEAARTSSVRAATERASRCANKLRGLHKPCPLCKGLLVAEFIPNVGLISYAARDGFELCKRSSGCYRGRMPSPRVAPTRSCATSAPSPARTLAAGSSFRQRTGGSTSRCASQPHQVRVPRLRRGARPRAAGGRRRASFWRQYPPVPDGRALCGHAHRQPGHRCRGHGQGKLQAGRRDKSRPHHAGHQGLYGPPHRPRHLPLLVSSRRRPPPKNC